MAYRWFVSSSEMFPTTAVFLDAASFTQAREINRTPWLTL